MPLDPSIALQVRPPQFEDIGTIRMRGLQLQQAQRANDQAERDQADQRTIADIYKQSLEADGQVDSAKLVQGVAAAGLGDRIPGIQKQILADQASRTTNRKAGIDADTAQLEQHKKKLDIVNGSLSSLVANPNVTQADVINQINVMVDQGIITPDEGAKSARALPGRPEALRPYLVQKALEAAEGSKRLEALLPKHDEQDRGGTLNEGTIDPLTGVRTAGADIQKTLTPGEIQSGENARTLANAGVSYQVDNNTGQLIAVPTKPGAGAITPRPVLDANGQPVAGKTLNDSQSKALLFASRGQAANKILEDLEAKGVTRPSIIKQGAEAIPVVGGLLGAAANAVVASPEQQQVEQAQRDFINATLRRESGAAINAGEFENGKKQYFPQIGDTPEVIAQKKQNRELAMRGILAEVPEGMRGQIDQQTPPAAVAPPAPTGARPSLDAIFGKRR